MAKSRIVMLVLLDNTQMECSSAWMPEGNMPTMLNEAVTFHEVLRAP